jgi:hypothetical protein
MEWIRLRLDAGDNNPVIGRRHQSQQRDLETEDARQDLLLLPAGFQQRPREEEQCVKPP